MTSRVRPPDPERYAKWRMQRRFVFPSIDLAARFRHREEEE
jgi:hypothetical protein